MQYCKSNISFKMESKWVHYVLTSYAYIILWSQRNAISSIVILLRAPDIQKNILSMHFYFCWILILASCSIVIWRWVLRDDYCYELLILSWGWLRQKWNYYRLFSHSCHMEKLNVSIGREIWILVRSFLHEKEAAIAKLNR